MGAHQLAPAGEVPGRAGGERTARQLLAIAEALGGKFRRHFGNEIERADAPLGGDIAGRHPHAGKAGHIGLDDVERRGGRRRGIERIAAGAQDAGAGLRRQRMRRRYHAMERRNGRAASIHSSPSSHDGVVAILPHDGSMHQPHVAQ
jgi:hypothetical protein